MKTLRENLHDADETCGILRTQLKEAEDTIAELEAIVEKVAKCWRLNESGNLVKDCPVVPGKVMYVLLGDGIHAFTCCYTRSDASISSIDDTDWCAAGVWNDGGGWEEVDLALCYDSEEAARKEGE